MDEDTLEYGKREGREEAVKIICDFLDIDETWVSHVVETYHNTDEFCKCKCELNDYEVDYCDVFSTPTEEELKLREQERKRQEAWEAVAQAQTRAHDEMVTKYQEMGWLP